MVHWISGISGTESRFSCVRLGSPLTGHGGGSLWLVAQMQRLRLFYPWKLACVSMGRCSAVCWQTNRLLLMQAWWPALVSSSCKTRIRPFSSQTAWMGALILPAAVPIRPYWLAALSILLHYTNNVLALLFGYREPVTACQVTGCQVWGCFLLSSRQQLLPPVIRWRSGVQV